MKRQSLLSGQWSKSQNNWRKAVQITGKPLLSGRQLLARVLQLLLPLLSAHQALDTFNLPLYYKYDEGKYSPRKQVLTDCWPAMPLPSLVCFKIKWRYCFKKIKHIYDEPLLSGQPPLGGHLTCAQEWPQINGFSTVYDNLGPRPS